MKPSEVIKVGWLNKSLDCIQPQEFTWLPPPKIETQSKRTEKQIFHLMPESYPSFSHEGCQVKRSKGSTMEKMAWSKNVINLEMYVKYYYRRRGRGASQSAGPGEAKKALQSEKHISLSGVPPKESTNTAIKNRSTFVKHRRHWERGWYGELWLPRCYH